MTITPRQLLAIIPNQNICKFCQRDQEYIFDDVYICACTNAFKTLEEKKLLVKVDVAMNEIVNQMIEMLEPKYETIKTCHLINRLTDNS